MTSQRSQNLLTIGLAVYLFTSLVAMAPMSIGAAVLLVLSMVAFGGFGGWRQRLREEWEKPLVRKFFLVNFWLAAACGVSVIAAWISPLSFGGRFIPANFSELGKLWYFFWPLILVPAFRAISEERRQRVLRVWIATFGVFSCIGIIQFFTGWPRPQIIPETHYYHATLLLGHHLSVASVFIFPYFAVLHYLWVKDGPKRIGISRALLALIFTVGTVMLLMTASRMLWLALPVGVLLWGFLNLPRKTALSLAIGLVLILGLASQHPAIQKRFGYSGVSEREELWKANFEFFKDRPVFGVGWRMNQGLSGIYFEHIRPGQPYFQGHAHNNLIDILAGTGAFGTIPWIAWALLVLWIAWLSAAGKGASAAYGGFARGLFCAWIVFQLNGLTQVNFWEGKVTHQMMIMASLSLMWIP